MVTATGTPDSTLTTWADAARAGGFPMPHRVDRWTPLRAGVVNLWEFEACEYWYANGWVQLTGRNETGKSSLMALTTLIPWLADTSSSNIDTLGRSGKKFRYYVEPTGADGDRRPTDGSTSRGWLWVEYGRVTEEGPRFFTVLQFAEARSASANLNLTWCTLEGRDRVRETVHLAPAREVATPKDLPAVVPHPDATRYRAHVAERLLGSTSDRLEAVGRMLRETRTPKLGANLQVAFVQEYLRNALPALSRSEVDALAAGWDQLDQIRVDLQATRDAADTLARFNRTAWLPWVRAVLRSSADEAASARSGLDAVTRDERAAEAELAGRQSQRQELSEQEGQARREAIAARTAADELQESARYRDAHSRILRLSAQRDRLTRLQDDHATRESEVTSAQTRSDADAAEVADRKADVAAGQAETDAAADTFAATVADHLGPVSRPIDEAWAGQALADRLARIRTATKLRDTADAQEAGAQTAEQAAQAASDEAEARAGEAEDAWRRAEVQREATANALAVWANSVRPSIATETADMWTAGLAATVDDDGRVPGPRLADVIRAAWYDPAHQELLRREQQATSLRRQAETELEGLQTQIDELLETRTPTYPVPALWQRRTRPQVSAAGAPLWSLLDPQHDADPTDLASVEAALAASGLLDAWVTAEGVYDPTRDGDDALIVVPPQVEGPSLHRVLRLAESAGPLSATVSGLLSSISYLPAGAAHAQGPAVSGDGQWTVGALAGRVQSQHGHAEWIGEAARASQRQRRIADLTSDREHVQARLRGIEGELSQITVALGELAGDLNRCPADDALRELLIRAGHLDRVSERAAAAADRAAGVANHRRAQASAALAELTRFCSGVDLPHTKEALSEAAEKVQNAKTALTEYRHAMQLLALVTRGLSDARARAEASAKEVGDRREALRKVAEERQAVRLAVETLEAATGADDQAILTELNTLKGAIASAEAHRDALTTDLQEVVGELRAAQTTLERTQADRETAQARRDQAYADFRALLDRGLAEELGLMLPNPTAASVEAVRDQVAEARRAVEPRTWPSTDPAEQRKVINSLASELHAKAGDARSELERAGRALRVITEDGLDRIEVTVDATGTPHPPRQAIDLVRQIHDELARNYNEQVQQTLDELLGSTFLEHLRDRLGATDQLIDQINDVLAQHPVVTTSTSLRIRLTPADEAEKILISAVRGPQLANPDVAARVRDELRGRVERAKTSAAREGDANWHDRLAQELDYRHWFEVSLQKRIGREGHWTPLTQRSFAEMSGGARAVMLMLPLVATLAAYYSEMPEAPRPLWLDEAFEGLDSANRATVMDLFHSFDLDVLLAGPARLVNVASVPAAAIYQVVRAPAPTPGVDLALELWAGGELRAIELPITLPSGGPSSQPDPLADTAPSPGMLL